MTRYDSYFEISRYNRKCCFSNDEVWVRPPRTSSGEEVVCTIFMLGQITQDGLLV